MKSLSVFSLCAAKSAGCKIRIAHSHSTTNPKEIKRNIFKNVLKPFSKSFANHYMCCSELAGRWLFGNKTYDKKDEKAKENIINSIVKTLTELREIDKVKIIINGESNDEFNNEYLRR